MKAFHVVYEGVDEEVGALLDIDEFEVESTTFVGQLGQVLS